MNILSKDSWPLLITPNIFPGLPWQCSSLFLHISTSSPDPPARLFLPDDEGVILILWPHGVGGTEVVSSSSASVSSMRRRSGRQCIEMAKWVESARLGTELARLSTELARLGTELARLSTELARLSSELARLSSESARLGTEPALVTWNGAIGDRVCAIGYWVCAIGYWVCASE